jgi:ATP-binding cassette subfamily F protein 3
MNLISGHGLGRQFDSDPIFLGLNLELRSGERVGLVGPNGAGKTTLIKLLARTEEPDWGQVSVRSGIRVGLLRQIPDFDPALPLLEVAKSGLASLYELQAELEEAAREMAEAETDSERTVATRRYEELRERIEHQDAYSIDHRVEEILSGLGFSSDELSRAAGTFSGGQQSRLMLAKLLLESPDVMLLDEPSNHLDIETTEWLESYLSRQPVAMVVVSHDRYFLDQVVTSIWELNFGELQVYPGNYTRYWKLKEERAKVLERQAERQEEEIEDLKEYIAKYSAGQRAKQAKDREKKLSRIERVATMRSVEGPVMGFGEVDRTGDIVLEARDLTRAFDQPLFSDFSLQVLRGQCVGILGPNGSGKSTLLKTLIGHEPANRGESRRGHKVRIGYLDQGLESLSPTTTLVRAVRPEDDARWVDQDTRDLLARFGLSGDIAFQPVSQLSGGERSKASLAKLAATNANVLALDEPTNHLDLWSRAALERSIQEFEGTVIVISHDRYFLNQVADRIIEVRDGRARVVEGNYETFERLRKAERSGTPANTSKSVQPIDEIRGRGGAKKSAPRKRKFAYRKPAEIEREIQALEAEFAATESLLGSPETYREPDRARQTQTRYDDLRRQIATLYEHWEEALERNA